VMNSVLSKITSVLLMCDLTFLLSLGMERIHFSTEKTDVQFLGHNGEPAFSGMNFSQCLTKFQANLNENILFVHITD
jgi:hypothetical protein